MVCHVSIEHEAQVQAAIKSATFIEQGETMVLSADQKDAAILSSPGVQAALNCKWKG